MSTEKKIYSDICLQRAEKASVGPWITEEKIWSNQRSDDVYFKYKIVLNGEKKKIINDASLDKADSEFVAHARTDVPELARRLKKACEELERISTMMAQDNQMENQSLRLSKFIEELESTPREK